GSRRDALVGFGLGAIAVGECIELLDIAQRMMGLPLDPGTQAGLQGRVIGFERPRGQERTVFEGEDLRLVCDQRHQPRIELNDDGTGSSNRHAAALCLCTNDQSSPLPPYSQCRTSSHSSWRLAVMMALRRAACGPAG